jgi:hypothetical protein
MSEKVGNDCAVEAIKFAVSLGLEADAFLNVWLHGEFDTIRTEWPGCPQSVFDGAEVVLNVATTYRAIAHSVNCPRCDFELTGLIGNPSGTAIECDECHNHFIVSENAEVRVD